MSGRVAVRRWPLLLAVVAVAAFTVGSFRIVDVRTDMAAFLPPGRTAASRFMLQQLQSGSAARIVLFGIEGAPPAALAKVSTAFADGLRRSEAFSLVSNGGDMLGGEAAEELFTHRYQLAPNVTAASFTAAALHADLVRLFQGLQSSASPLVQRFGLPDPTGAFPAAAAAWAGRSAVRLVEGVWFAPDRDRALLVAQTRAAGMDIGAQDRVAAAVQAAFAAAAPGQARLLQSGAPVFARESAASIRADVQLLSVVSGGLVVGLLLWRFRSVWVLAAVCVPIVAGVAVAALVTQAVFGFVHGIALGFGMTMLGVTVDYPVLLIGHRRAGEPAWGTLRRIGRAFALAVLCAALGLTGMVFAGFPGIAQLGLFAAVGVVTAAAVTGLALPRLIVAANLAPVWAGDPGQLLQVERLRRWRLWGLVPVAAAAGLLAVHAPRWDADVADLSPIPAAARALDDQLRQEVGAPGLGQALVVRGATPDAVLAQQQALEPGLAALQRQGQLAGWQDAAALLPPAALQRARQAALPDGPTLRDSLAEAAQGLPFTPAAFEPFVQDVGRARDAAPVVLADFQAPALAARLNALLFPDGAGWAGPVALDGAAGPALQWAAGQQGAVLVDMHAETNGLVSQATRRALAWLAGGAVMALAALLAGLRAPLMVGRIALAIGSAELVTVAVLTAAGVPLSMLHLVALQFTAGIGLDYALFYARRQLDAEERARTLRTLVTCNAMTLLTFGLLAVCRTAVLSAIGITVAIGAISAMCFSFLFVGLRPEHDAAPRCSLIRSP